MTVNAVVEPSGVMPPAASSALVEFRGISKTYNGTHALADVNLRLAAGETVGLVGKNGAGKSTLMKVLAGAVAPDSGQVVIEGRVEHLPGPRDATRLGMAFVHQDLMLGLAPNLTVAENVGLGLGYPRSLGIFCDRRRQWDHAEEILALLGVSLNVRAQASTLTVVQQRLVTIARALSQQAKLVVLDEPSTSLSPAEIEHLYKVIDHLHDTGVAVVYVSHRLTEVFRLSQKMVVMRDGRVVGEAPTSELDEGTLIHQITGDVQERFFADRRQGVAGKERLRVEGLSAPPRVKELSFSLHKGEILGLAGLVGSGRTEAVRAIYGADRKTSGRVYINGAETRIESPRDALRHRIVLLPEHRVAQGMIPDFSIRANITLPTLDRHRNQRFSLMPVPSKARERETAAVFMERLHIVAKKDEQRATALSGGNQQKVIVSKWLHHGADIYMFDEPTQGIDVLGKEDIYEIMHELADAGASVIFISSEFVEIERVCDRVLVLREGKLVNELAGDKITEARILESCFRIGSP